jgi:spore maturation protein CgeB
MKTQLRRILDDPAFARYLAERGRATVLARHTCAHRVDELLGILDELNASERAAVTA